MKCLKIIFRSFGEYFGVGLKFNKCTRLVCVADYFKVALYVTALKTLVIYVTLPAYLDFKPLGKSVNYR